MTAFVQRTHGFEPWQRFVAAGQSAFTAVRRWETRRLAAARTRNMSMQRLQSMGLRSPQALAVRYGVAVPTVQD
jgi:hypothetical protein